MRADALFAHSSREILVYVGGATRDYITTTLPDTCNFFDPTTFCAENTYTGLTILRSDGTTLTTQGQACTTAPGNPWDEFGLQLLDGLDTREDGHCHAGSTTLGHQELGRIYTTFNSSTTTDTWTHGVHSHWNDDGMFNSPGYLMLR